MSVTAMRLERMSSVPLAVIRRTATPADLARLVPECCGLVWNAVRAQHAKAGRHVAVHWDGSIRLEVGVELLGSFVEQGEVVRSATPGGLVAALPPHVRHHAWLVADGRPVARGAGGRPSFLEDERPVAALEGDNASPKRSRCARGWTGCW
jgi:hypothetical protein